MVVGEYSELVDHSRTKLRLNTRIMAKESAGVLNQSSGITEETEDGMKKTKSVQNEVPILLAKKLAMLS